jgi:hypothetical protein
MLIIKKSHINKIAMNNHSAAGNILKHAHESLHTGFLPSREQQRVILFDSNKNKGKYKYIKKYQ